MFLGVGLIFTFQGHSDSDSDSVEPMDPPVTDDVKRAYIQTHVSSDSPTFLHTLDQKGLDQKTF